MAGWLTPSVVDLCWLAPIMAGWLTPPCVVDLCWLAPFMAGWLTPLRVVVHWLAPIMAGWLTPSVVDPCPQLQGHNCQCLSSWLLSRVCIFSSFLNFEGLMLLRRLRGSLLKSSLPLSSRLGPFLLLVFSVVT